MMKKKVTIKDLSLQLNISTATISMILNKRNIERFAPETIQKVYQLAEDSGYRTKRQRSLSLVGPTDKLIFIICPSLFNPFYTTIIQGIESLARPKAIPLLSILLIGTKLPKQLSWNRPVKCM